MGSEEKKRVEDMSLEELEEERERLRTKLRPTKAYRPGMYSREPKVASTEKVVCRAKMGEIHNAILLIYEDGTIKVKCSGECYDCEYED
jgi:hypothetical protein